MAETLKTMSLYRLEKAIITYQNLIKKHYESGNTVMAMRYERDLKQAEYQHNIRRDELKGPTPGMDQEFITRLTRSLKKEYDPDEFKKFISDLRIYLQNNVHYFRKKKRKPKPK